MGSCVFSSIEVVALKYDKAEARLVRRLDDCGAEEFWSCLCGVHLVTSYQQRLLAGRGAHNREYEASEETEGVQHRIPR